MPRSLNPQSYKQAFWTLLELSNDALPRTVVFPSQRQAQRWRFSWYDFVRALRARKHHLLEHAERLSLRIEGAAVVIDLTGNAEDCELVLAALRDAPRTTLPHEPQATPQQPAPTQALQSERTAALMDALDKEFGIKDK